MSNADVANELTQLREYVASGAIPPDEAAAAFERLTFLLMDTSREDEQRLAEIANELEVIRFTRLPKDQVSEMRRVMEDAQHIFNALIE